MRRLIFVAAVCAMLCAALWNASAQEGATGQITGRLQTPDGVPMSGGLMYFFSAYGPAPAPERYWRVPDVSVPLGESGDFSVDLPAGEYFIGAIKRLSGKTEAGPPLEGDLFFQGSSLDENAVPPRFAVVSGQKLDLGTLNKVLPYKGHAKKDKVTSIQGRVTMGDGKPVEGAIVFAYLNPAMAGKPAFASHRTGPDGRYTLRVHQGGTFFLRVRDVYGGGPPEAGALIGNLGGDVPQPVAVKTGKTTKGIDIMVERFRGRGQQSLQGPPQ